MDATNQKKKMLLTGIIIAVSIFAITLVVLLILMQQENKKTKFQIKNVVYNTKSIYISLSAENANQELAGTYEQKEILINNQYVPITITTPDGRIYYNIEIMAKLVGYKYNNGAYGEEIDETKDKCYIDNGGEYVTYLLDSNEITKNIKLSRQYTDELKNVSSSSETNELDKESFTLKQPVIQFENSLYASEEAIAKGLNMSITHKGSIIDIKTLEELVTGYKSSLLKSGYTLTANFKNQRALSSGYAVVGKDDEYGVLDLKNGKEVISLKYDSIEFVQSIEEFIVSSKSNFGMQKPGSQTPTIKLEYESIKLLNAEKKLYIVKKNDKYGVINAEGNEVIPTEYDQIGLRDTSSYKSQGQIDKYIIGGECIPVMRNGSYGLYSIDGTLLASTRFTTIGCQNPKNIINNTSAMPTLTIPLSDTVTGIVFAMKNAAGTTSYGIITTKGTIVLNAYYTAIYYMQRNGNITYYFNKPANNELLTLKELLATRDTVKELIEQTKSKEEQEDEEKREQEYLNKANQSEISSGSKTENNDDYDNNDDSEENND